LNKKLKTLVVWIALVVLFLAAFQLADDRPDRGYEFATFAEHVNAGEVQRIRIDGNEITVSLWNGSEYVTLGVVDDELTRTLSEQGALIAWGKASNPLRTILTVLVPLALFLAILVYFVRKNGAGTANIMTIRKSTARTIESGKGITFQDVGGCEDAKEQLLDVIDFLKQPKRWTDSGVRLPRGVLLEGPPGCGKTLLARAVAGETDASFLLVSASEFVEMFVGVGAARVRDTFEMAAKDAPAVIFIDELDAVGRRRGSGVGAAHDEREQTLNQILVCMDGFEQNDRVVVIAATNRADILDAALLRAGRFDRRVAIPSLSRDQRVEVLKIHTRDKQLAQDVNLEEIAERTTDRSGADLECLANEAGLLAVRRLRQGSCEAVEIGRADFLRALEAGEQERRRFDCVDALLLESTTQLAQPVGKARVRLTLVEGALIEGELVWADATFVKVRGDGDDEHALVSKAQIKTLESLDGTEWVESAGIAPDQWAARTPDLA